MVINVSQQLKEPVGSIRHHRVSKGSSGGLLDGELTLLRTDRGILVRGTLTTSIQAVCSRCLSAFDQRLTLNIEEEYLPTADPPTGTSLSKGEEGTFVIDEQQQLDLGEAVRQYSLLALPMKPLCREGCAGLCPSCGHNLNLGSCSCPSRAADPRFSQLASLFCEQGG